MKRYWNYSVHFNPRDKHTFPPKGKRDMYEDYETCERDCKEYCRSEGCEFDAQMIAEITDLVDQ